MKKFTFLLMTSALLMSGSAVAKNSQSESQNLSRKTNGQMIFKSNDRQKSMLDSKAKSLKKNSAAKASEFGDIIYEAPEGEVKNLARSGDATYSYYGMLVNTTYENMFGEFVMCENGDVYMKNPISQYITDSYIKGKLNGNQIVFSLPQPVEVMDYNGEDLFFLVTMMHYADEWYYPCNTPEAAELGMPEITNQFVVNINEDGSYSMDTAEGMLVPGMIYSDNFAWTGYSDLSAEWKEFSATANPGPAEGVEVNDVVVLYSGVGHYAKLAMDGDDVFVQGIFIEQPESWIQGKRDGNKISFQSGQYLGKDLDYSYYTFFAAATAEQAWDPDYEEWYDVYKYDKEIVFDFDEATMTMTSGEDKAAVYNTSDKTILYLNVLNSPMIKTQPAEISQTPQNPSDLIFYDYIDSYGYSWLEFNLPMQNVNDELLNPNDLFYIIYVDGDEMVFDPQDYPNIDEDMTLIPYGFNDNYDFISDGQYHEVYFYFDGADEIGVQLCSVKDGEIVGESDIVSVSTSGSAVKTVADADGKRIESTRYFNMHGQEVSTPADGIFVKTVKYDDGSVRSFKVAFND